jgi:hypothetical protein
MTLVAVLICLRMLGPGPLKAQEMGTKLSPQPADQNVAGRTVHAQVCEIKGQDMVGKSSMKVTQGLEVVGKNLVLVTEEGQLLGFKIDTGSGCSLQRDPSFGEDGLLSFEREVKHISRAGKDRIVASHGIFAMYLVEGGKEVGSCQGKGYAEVHPSGTWGLSPFANSTVRRIEYTGSSCTMSDWVLKDLGQDDKREGIFTNVNSIGFLDDTIFVGGILAKSEHPKSPKVIAAYDKNGGEKFRFGNTEDTFAEDKFGWIHAIQACGDGLCVLDSNGRKLTLWSAKGEFRGSVDLKKLFDLKYPWISGIAVTEDGSAYFAVGQDRADAKVAEGLVYRVTGLL